MKKFVLVSISSLLMVNQASALTNKTIMTQEVIDNIQKLKKTKACESCNLRGADLKNLNLEHANLKGADLTDANFFKTYLGESDLSGAKLINVSFNMGNVNFTKFSNANLTGSTFLGTNATNAQFNRANLTKANFNGAQLENAVFNDANLTQSILIEQNLTKVSLLNADFTKTNINRAKIKSGQLTQVKHLDQALACGLKIKQDKPDKTNVEDFINIDSIGTASDYLHLSNYTVKILRSIGQLCGLVR